jgi:hypothetical protein
MRKIILFYLLVLNTGIHDFVFGQTKSANSILRKSIHSIEHEASNSISCNYQYRQVSYIDSTKSIVGEVIAKGLINHAIKNPESDSIFVDSIFIKDIQIEGKRVLYFLNEFYYILMYGDPIANYNTQFANIFIPRYYSHDKKFEEYNDVKFVDESCDSLYIIETTVKDEAKQLFVQKGIRFYAKYYIRKSDLSFEKIILKSEKYLSDKFNAAFYFDVTYAKDECNRLYPSSITAIHPKFQLGIADNYKFYAYDYFNIKMQATNTPVSVKSHGTHLSSFTMMYHSDINIENAKHIPLSLCESLLIDSSLGKRIPW